MSDKNIIDSGAGAARAAAPIQEKDQRFTKESIQTILKKIVPDIAEVIEEICATKPGRVSDILKDIIIWLDPIGPNEIDGIKAAAAKRSDGIDESSDARDQIISIDP